MKYLSLKNLSSLDVIDRDPQSVLPAPRFVEEEDGEPNKKKFREWCADKNTDHCFYSHAEGLVPSTRITRDNPALYLHGFTADYDASQSKKEVKTLIIKNSTWTPRWISQTFSGGIRLTWEFEKPVLVDNEALAIKFMEELVKELGVDRLAIGYDESSQKLQQYFEAGRDWEDMGGEPLNSKVLSAVFFRAANKTKIAGDFVIPIEDVAAEVEKRWPGRASISVGARVPLFWVEPFEDRTGAQVGDHGMLCYSSRAGKSFVPWGEILGNDFMKQYQAQRIGNAADGLYFDGGNYWRHDDHWRKRNTEETHRWLRVSGISPKPVKGSNFGSEIDMVLLASQAQNEVKAAVPIVHNNNQIVLINGEKFLNISEKKLVQPAESGDPVHFPWLWDFVNNAWDAPCELQRDHYLAWLRYAYVQCLAGNPAQGQAVFIAGPTSVGKTFWNLRVLGVIFDGAADPTEYLLGNTNFNKDLAESYIWACDDSKYANTWESKMHFANSLKKHVANPQVRCEGKHKDATVLPYYGRISATCNTNAASLEAIPNLTDSTICDKVSLFRWKNWDAHFLAAHGSNAVARHELPHFLKWLIDWTPPASVVGSNPRFGVLQYHHPQLMSAAVEAGAGARLREMLEIWWEDGDAPANARKTKEKIWATPTKLRRWLSEDPSFRDNLKEFSRHRMAVALEELGVDTRKASVTSVEYLVFDPSPKHGVTSSTTEG